MVPDRTPPSYARRANDGSRGSGLAEDYKYDIFVSYAHEGAYGTWVKEVFHPLLEGRLHNQAGVDPKRMFFDLRMQRGGLVGSQD